MIRDYNQVPPKRLCSHIAVYPPPQTIGKVNNGLSSTPIAIHGLYTQPESSGSKSAYKSATDVADLIVLATIRIWYMLSDRIGSDRIGVIRLDHAMGSTKLPGTYCNCNALNIDERASMLLGLRFVRIRSIFSTWKNSQADWTTARAI